MGSRCRSRIVFLSILVLLFHSLTQLSNAADRITKGQSIKDGETLTSSTAENFALGFFSPGNSTNRYVGIWYNKLSVRTVVWVANRENPISNSSGVLTIQSDGNLKVLDGNGKSLWSTNVSIVPGSNSTAVLMDTGNFLLCGEEIGVVDKALWQSFEDPTDTFLPGMRAGLNIKNGETKTSMYTSWKSSSDPAKGNFTMGVDPTGLAQIVIWENSKRHWRSGLWNGQIFIGVPGMRPRWLYGFQLSDLDGSKYFTYTALSSSDILMFQIRWNGIEEQLRWNESAKNWSRFWIQPSNICQVYNTCGAYASCSMSSSPICTCIKGFEPKSMTDWNRGNWSGGCKRRTQLQCERNSSSAAAVKGDGFLELDAVKLPDHSVWKSDLGSTQCEDNCLKNCSCKAYAIVTGIGCLTWGGDLVDLQNFQQGGNKLFVRLANSELGKKKKIATWIIILCVILGIILLSTFAYLIWRKCKAKPKGKFTRRKKIYLARLLLLLACLTILFVYSVLLGKGTKESTGIDMNKSREMWSDFSEQNDMGEGNNGSVPELPLLSLEVIVAATDNFSPANKLGQGGFGPVYKGRLPCGEEVAIKRLSRKSGQGAEEFKNEIILIAKLQHINLVRLLGCCIEAEEKILVYEYLPNKSLDAFIFDPNMNVQLDWQKRFNIIEGIARGILYLHRDSRLRIIHRDLKASNILLDGEMNPKISDFGMAKIFGGNQNEANTNRVVGTYGYMAPEYAMEGLFSVKSDVYSFGVLLLEILSGKKCTQYRHPESLLNLLGYFWKIWNEGKVMDFIDPCIKDSCSKGDVLRCVQVGLLCVQDLPMDRPLMSIVVLMLESETTVLPTPRQPNFMVGRTPVEMDLTIDSSETMSRNDVTVTMVQGR